jgi:HEAT repeat protein
MKNDRSGLALLPPMIAVGLSACVFIGLVLVYYLETRAERVVADLPGVVAHLPETAGTFDLKSIMECREVLALAAETAPGVLALYESSPDNERVRVLCMTILATMRHDEGVSLCLDALRSRSPFSVDYVLWCSAPERLGSRIVEPLGEIIERSDDPELVRDALRALRQTKSPNAVAIYEKVLARSDDAEMRRNVISYLQAIDSPNTVLVMEGLFTDSDPQVVEWAIDSMDSFVSSEPTVREVMGRAIRSKNERVRAAAVGIMDRLGHVTGLIGALESEDEVVAVEAGRRLQVRMRQDDALVKRDSSRIRQRLLALIEVARDRDRLLVLAESLVPFVDLDDREYLFETGYLPASVDQRIVYTYLLGHLAGQDGSRREPHAEGFEAIRSRMVQDLHGLDEFVRPIYREALYEISGMRIEPVFEAWQRFDRARALCFEAEALTFDAKGEKITTYPTALRNAIKGKVEEAREIYRELAAEGRRREGSGYSSFKRDLGRIEQMIYFVDHHAAIYD